MNASAPWNDWYHCNGNTYGTWLRGDERGWRARHHREHVDGDYRNPPERGKHEQKLDWSHRIMQRPPVHLSPEARRVACASIVESFQRHSIELVAACVDNHHFHLLAKFPDHEPRRWVGIAKRASACALSYQGLVPPGGVWAVRFRYLYGRDREHQINIARYIISHAKRGATAWSISKAMKNEDKPHAPGT